MSSHGLLLRLFQSPGFFSVLRALQYIRNYSDNIGITHYLTRRLSQLPAHELADKWMLVCHLLVTRPSASTALENLVLKKAEESTLIALLTLFFFQASLNDLATTKRDTQPFIICSRVLQSVTLIIFSEPPSQSTYDNDAEVPPLLPRRKIKAHLKPALVGLGAILASCPGVPMLVDVVGNVAIDQGRFIDPKVEASSPVDANETARSIPVPLGETLKDLGDESDTSDDAASTEREEDVEAYGRALIAARDAKQRHGNITIIAPLSPPLVRRNTTASSPSSPIDRPPETGRQRRLTAPRPTSSVPSLPNTATPFGFSFPGQSPLYKSRLLRSHYLHSEIQFLQTLATIADRLLVIPRPARVSALRAELTNLNHQLPAEICLPLWCNYPRKQTHLTDVQSHHRVVRIPPSESVVLNSAERAPYMLLVEVLHDNMDFDPLSAPNKEILSNLQKNGPSHIKDSLPGQLAYDQQRLAPVQIDEATTFSPSLTVQSTQLSPLQIPTEEDEMDLVEQLYGANLSVRSVDVELTDSIALPLAPKNKALDIATWSRKSTSSPSTPRISTSLPAGGGSNHRRFPSVSSEDATGQSSTRISVSSRSALTLEEYSNRMEAAAVMLAQLDANVVREPVTGAFGVQPSSEQSTGVLSWIPGSGWIMGTNPNAATPADGIGNPAPVQSGPSRMRLQAAEAAAIKKRIMEEMMALEEERMARMKDAENSAWTSTQDRHKTAQDEGIVRRELNKVDPSAAVVQETFASKKDRIRASSPYGHLANWDCISVIVKTGADLRQEQLAGLLIQEFSRIWKEEHCPCWVRYFRILITGSNSGLVETITDAISIHSIKKAEYARRLVEGRFTNVSLKDYFIASYGDPSSAKFARAQKNFAKSLAGYSVISYLLQIKDRHNGNLLLDRDGHIIHIDFGFILESSPGGNLGFEAAPFKLPLEYVELLGGMDSQPWLEFKQHFRQGFETARKHCDSIITIVELMQKDSTFPCFAAFGEMTAQRLRDRFQPTLTHSLVADHVEKLIATSVGSAWTRLYDSFQYYSQGVL